MNEEHIHEWGDEWTNEMKSVGMKRSLVDWGTEFINDQWKKEWMKHTKQKKE